MEEEQIFSEKDFKKLLIPFTTKKAVYLIIIVGILVFFNSLFNGFVGDDNAQTLDNVATHSIANIFQFFTASTFSFGNGIQGIYYKPLLLTTYSLIYSIFGANAFFFHLFQSCFFVANSVLVFLLLRKFLSRNLAFLISIIFLVHPINEEVASYISTLQDTMFFFFGMLGMLISTSKNSKLLNLKVYMLLIISILFKETGIAFFLINIGYVLLFRKDRLKSTFVYTLLFLTPYILIHQAVIGNGFIKAQDYQISRLSLFGRMLSIPAIIIFYLLTFVFPLNLAEGYDWAVTNPDFSNFYFPLLTCLLLIVVTFFIGKFIYQKHSNYFKSFVFFMIWFLIGLGLHIQLIPLDSTVATRWFYLPLFGLLGMIGVVLQILFKSKRSQKILTLAGVLIIILFSIRTIIRNGDFKDNMTLACHDASVSQNNYSLENSCGGSLYLAGNYDEAQKHLELATKLNPKFGQSWYALGLVLGTKAEMNKDHSLIKPAETDLETAINVYPNNFWFYDTLGYMYVTYNEPQTAKTFLENALKLFPNDPALWHYLAIAEYKAGNKQNALQYIKNSYSLNPKDQVVAQLYNDLTNGKNIQTQPAF